MELVAGEVRDVPEVRVLAANVLPERPRMYLDFVFDEFRVAREGFPGILESDDVHEAPYAEIAAWYFSRMQFSMCSRSWRVIGLQICL